MAHELNMINGTASYIGRQAAWHKLGTVTGKYQTTEELLADQSFAYDVVKAQLKDPMGRTIEAWGAFRWNHEDRDARRIGNTVFLGTIGKDRAIIQNAEGFKSIDAVMRTADGAHYESAGVLGNGERVWALADLGLTARVGDDVQKGYLLFSTSHDGTMAHSYRFCFERVVCANTLGMALSEKTKAELTIRHTKNASSRLADARTSLNAMGSDVARIEDRLNFLAGRKMNREALTSIMDRLFPKRLDADSGESKDTTRRSNILADIMKTYELNDGNAFPEQRGTAYNLLNAITNYTDHQRGGDENRAESAMFGSGDLLKSRAMEVIEDASNGLDEVRGSRSVTVDWGSLGMKVAARTA